MTTPDCACAGTIPLEGTADISIPGLRAAIYRGVGAEREQCEQDLVSSGVNLPLPHRCVWARMRRDVESWFVAVRDAGGRCHGGIAVEAARSRALPGCLLLRIERLGEWLDERISEIALAALAQLARRTSGSCESVSGCFRGRPMFDRLLVMCSRGLGSDRSELGGAMWKLR